MVILNINENYPLISTYRDNYTIVLKPTCIEIYEDYVLVGLLKDNVTLREKQARELASVYINTTLSKPKRILNFTAEICTYRKGCTCSFGVLHINHMDNTSAEIRIIHENYCDSDDLKKMFVDIFSLWYGTAVASFDDLQMAFPNITRTIEKADKGDIMMAQNRCFSAAKLIGIREWNKAFKVLSKDQKAILMAPDAELFSTPRDGYIIKSNRLLRSLSVSVDYDNSYRVDGLLNFHFKIN